MLSIENAQRLKNDYSYLIGDDYKGGTIDVLLIVPRKEEGLKTAIKEYIMTRDSSMIYPAGSDNGYTVIAMIDVKRIDTQGFIIQEGIFSILNEKEIEINYSDYGIEL